MASRKLKGVAVHLALLTGDRPEAHPIPNPPNPHPGYPIPHPKPPIPHLGSTSTSQAIRQIQVHRHYRVVQPTNSNFPPYAVLEPLVRKNCGKSGPGKRYESLEAYVRNNSLQLGPAVRRRVDEFITHHRPILAQRLLDCTVHGKCKHHGLESENVGPPIPHFAKDRNNISNLLHFQAKFLKDSPDDVQERLPDDLLGKPWVDQKFRQEGAKQKGAPKDLRT